MGVIEIIVGTNRPKSKSLQVARMAQKRFESLGVNSNIIEIEKLSLNQLDGSLYGKLSELPQDLREAIERLNNSQGIYVVCPEYNGSMPGALKYFIDFWEYPRTFESRPVAFVGLGGRFGGLRPVEHLQQVFGYRNAYIFPERIFIMNVWDSLGSEGLLDKSLDELWSLQIQRFSKFVDSRCREIS